jgi:hypothetical protein
MARNHVNPYSRPDLNISPPTLILYILQLAIPSSFQQLILKANSKAYYAGTGFYYFIRHSSPQRSFIKELGKQAITYLTAFQVAFK